MKYSFLQSQFFYPLRQKIIPCKNNLIFKSILKSKHSNTCWASMGLLLFPYFSSVQFSRSVMSDSLRPQDCSMPGLPVHHQLPELAKTHVHQVSDAIQASHPLSFSSPPAFNLSKHQGLFQWVSSSHKMAKILEFQLRHQAFQWIYSELISFWMDWFDLLAVQGTFKSLLQHHSSKAWILQCSAFFIVQLSHPCMTTGKTIALIRQTFVGKVMSLLVNMVSRLVTAFLPRSKHLLISWLQSPSAVILETGKYGWGIGWGDHFLPHKFTKRSLECWATSTKQLLNTTGGHQAPR